VSRLIVVILGAVGLLFAAPSLAQEEESTAPYAYRQLPDPAQESKAQALMETLRCLQCQGQSIADSDAPIAGSMRSLVRERIAAGEDPEAIRAWLMERYGDYVSYAPQFTSLTWPLFAVPLVLILLAVLLLRRRFRRGGEQ
jgi:cytochrome c-type biogenesis protein CcmH